MNFCECGCGKEIKEGRRFSWGHSCVNHTEKTKKLIGIKTKEALADPEIRKKIGENTKNSEKFQKSMRSPERRKLMREINTRKDINKESIFKSINEVINKYGIEYFIDNGKRELFKLVCKKLNCSLTPIKRVFGNIDNILKELNLDIPKLGKKSRKKMSESAKKRKSSDKTRKKISEANKKYVSLEKIGDNLVNIIMYRGPISMNEFRNDNSHRDFSNSKIKSVLKENNMSLDDLAKSRGVEFTSKIGGNIGKNEKQILDDLEEITGHKIERQKYISNLKYYLDGYISKTNTAIEIDEYHHFVKDGKLRIEDVIRENKIKKELDCNFNRIKDKLGEKDNLQKGLSDFQ